MTLLQECVAGISWSSIVIYSAALLVMAGFMLIIGIPFRKLNNFFEEQLEKTGYM